MGVELGGGCVVDFGLGCGVGGLLVAGLGVLGLCFFCGGWLVVVVAFVALVGAVVAVVVGGLIVACGCCVLRLLLAVVALGVLCS